LDLAGGRRAAEVGQTKIHEHDVGHRLRRDSYGIVSIARHARHGEVTFRREDLGDGGRKERVVLHNQHPHATGNETGSP
jgi:hypothetical protein